LILALRDKTQAALVVTDVAGRKAGVVAVSPQQPLQFPRAVAGKPQLVAQPPVVGKIQPRQARQRGEEKAAAPAEPQQGRGVVQRAGLRRRNVGEQEPPVRLQLGAPKIEQLGKFVWREILNQRIGDDEIERGLVHGFERAVLHNPDARFPPEARAQFFPHMRRGVVEQQRSAILSQPGGGQRLAAAVIQHERVGRRDMRAKVARDGFVMQLLVAVAGVNRRVAVPEIEPAIRAVPPHGLSFERRMKVQYFQMSPMEVAVGVGGNGPAWRSAVIAA